MVIISDKVGQLCNRLFHFSYFIANSMEYGYKVINPCFDEYNEYFDSTLTDDFLGLPVSTKITPSKSVDKLILKCLSRYKFLFPNVYLLDIRANNTNAIYDLKNADYKKLANDKIILTKGWLFKDEENLKKHRETLIQIFKPAKKYADEAREIISKLRAGFDCIVGVHIRRGDYLSWNNGKYFFQDELYLNKMGQMKTELNSKGQTCCFFLCSNEKIDKDSFSHLNVSIDERHFITDLYALAGCDYIMGPPSTFSYWASFYGNKPLLILENGKANIALDKFLFY